MLDNLKKHLPGYTSQADFDEKLARLRHKAPIPVFWLFGKTQSGKTSIIKFLTGADDAEIGQGFRPCTRFSREYRFPTPVAPLLTFLDTRGLEEPGYDPREDFAQFDKQTHVLVVTVKLLDHAVEKVVEPLKVLRAKRRDRPVILAVTCLHEAYPQQQHLFSEAVFQSGSWRSDPTLQEKCPGLFRSLQEHEKRFEGLVDQVVPIDLTPAEEGFEQPNYGGEHLKIELLKALPAGYRQTLLHLDEATRELQDLYARRAMPHILGYSSLAATAGAVPIPWLDLLILPGIQTQMIFHLAKLYGQPLSAQRFLELAGTLGLGVMVRQAVREVVKFIPFVGSVAGAALAGSSTYALGKAFCFYYSAVHKGHVPQSSELKAYYQEQLSLAEKLWKKS